MAVGMQVALEDGGDVGRGAALGARVDVLQQPLLLDVLSALLGMEYTFRKCISGPSASPGMCAGDVGDPQLKGSSRMGSIVLGESSR